MCFFCASLTAACLAHLQHRYTTLRHAKAHVCIRLALQTGSFSKTSCLECESTESYHFCISSHECAAGDPTHEGPLEPSISELKPVLDDRTLSTLSPLEHARMALRVWSGGRISTSSALRTAGNRFSPGRALLMQKERSGLAFFLGVALGTSDRLPARMIMYVRRAKISNLSRVPKSKERVLAVPNFTI